MKILLSCDYIVFNVKFNGNFQLNSSLNCRSSEEEEIGGRDKMDLIVLWDYMKFHGNLLVLVWSL